jgi:rhodanese-related sulfurtransferase
MFALLMGLKSVSPSAVQQLNREGAVTVIDVNSRESFTAAHVPGAVNLDPVTYAENQLPANRDAEIVFYCSNSMCRKAPNAAKRAKKMGYRNVRVMSAGIKGWVGANLPTDGGS